MFSKPTFRLYWMFAILATLTTGFSDPIAHLDYGTFQGKHNIQLNISHFRRIPYAAPPTGQNRFRAPQPPIPIKDVYDSNRSFPGCPQRTSNGSEDCLFLGLYSRPWTAPTPKRPVVVFFYGGAFIQGAASFGMPPSGYPILNVSKENDFILVYPNYRVNAFGFLPGRRVKESADSDLNPGLLDQQYVLQWVQKYISQFGGDPDNVAIFGQSAGAGSVLAQMIANGGETKPQLFNKALASSPFWPKTYRYDSPEAEAIYDQMIKGTGCDKALDSLRCLKEVDVQKIRDASAIVAASHTHTTSSYTWAPVVDGNFLREPLSMAANNGRVNGEVVFTMYNSHEGENFIPGGLSKNSTSGGSNTFDKWLQGFLPGLNTTMLQRVRDLYPANGKTETLVYNDAQIRGGLISRDVVLACPAYWVTKNARKAGWIGEYTISPAKHASDVAFVSQGSENFKVILTVSQWNTVNAIQKTRNGIYEAFAGSFASFFQTGNPNSYEKGLRKNDRVPEIRTGLEMLVTSEGLSATPLPMLEERCSFWQTVGGQVPV
jgi:carboxylesterase type B